MRTRLTGCRSQKTYNNHIGLPLFEFSKRRDRHDLPCSRWVPSNVGEIRELAAIALPEVGIVTGIGDRRSGRLWQREHIVEAKGELVEALPAAGLAVVNGDDAQLPSDRTPGRPAASSRVGQKWSEHISREPVDRAVGAATCGSASTAGLSRSKPRDDIT